MGASGVSLFEDDSALDMLAEYEHSGAAVVARALDTANATPVTDDLDRDAGAAARAAAEIVAVALGDLPDAITQDQLARLNAHGTDVRALPDIKSRAKAAVNRIISDNSELHELWMEGDQSAWVAAINDLQRRLG